MRLIPLHLAPRLILAITGLVAVVMVVSVYFSVRAQEQQLLEEMTMGADQLSRSITAATWEAMLADQRQAAYQVMRAIGEQKGIDSIRIFNKQGRVTFSTDPGAPDRVNQSAEACFLCHAREKPLVRVDVPSRARIFVGKDGRRNLAMVTPIYNEARCSGAPCHAHPQETNVLGVLDIAMDLERVDNQVAAIEVRAVVTVIVEVILIGVVITLFTRHFVDVPIRKLIERTKAIGGMQLGSDRRDGSMGGEFGELAASFDVMERRLKDALDRITDFTQQLERKVEERSQQLSLAQSSLIQSDRLASLGQLAASVVHEINNPVSGILNLSMLLQRLLTEDGVPPERLAQFRSHLESISRETARVGRIVSDLLAFSRHSRPRRTEADLNLIVQATLPLLEHKLKLLGVRLHLELSNDLPRVLCDASQIQQVIVNLVLNGAEATPAGGRIAVRTRLDDANGVVLMEIEDSGVGIPEENIPRIFDPFFTTKETGGGVGLGLSVVHGIVDGHGGRIEVASAIGTGSRFTVYLPLQAEATAADAESPIPNSAPDGV